MHFLPPSVQGRASYLLNASARINCFRNGQPTRVQTDAPHSLRVSLRCFRRPLPSARAGAIGPSHLGYPSPQPHARLSTCFHCSNVPFEPPLTSPVLCAAP